MRPPTSPTGKSTGGNRRGSRWQRACDSLAAGDVGTVQAGADTLGAATSAIELALEEAEEQDQSLIKLIRRELQSPAEPGSVPEHG